MIIRLAISFLMIFCCSIYCSYALGNNNAVKPKRLQKGDTVQLITPSHAISKEQLRFAKERIQALGLKVKISGTILDEYGYFAGTIDSRAKEINQAFLDPEVKAIIAVRGGSGLSQLLNKLDYSAIKKNPKIVLGYSDLTSLLVAINKETNLVTFHGPMAAYKWPEFSVEYVKSILFDSHEVSFKNQNKEVGEEDLIQTEFRTLTITPGKVKVQMIGGNLTVLTNMIGSKQFPTNWENKILFLEDVGEDIYKIDRMLAQLKNAGVLDQITGFVFGTCEDCDSECFGNFRLEDVLFRYIKPLGIPAYMGAMIGHQDKMFTIPIGTDVEMNSTLGEINMIEPAVEK